MSNTILKTKKRANDKLEETQNKLTNTNMLLQTIRKHYHKLQCDYTNLYHNVYIFNTALALIFALQHSAYKNCICDDDVNMTTALY